MTNDPGWTLADPWEELRRFEAEAQRAGLRENTVHTYVDRTGIFLRWLGGEYQFQGPKS